MVELRKRTRPPPPPPPAKKKATPKAKAKAGKAKKEDAAALIPVPNGNPDAPKILLGFTVNLDDFGGEVQTNDEKKVTLAKLVEDSKAGVVLFTYPKASTPGCTTQVCLFRDSYVSLGEAGLSVYGLSNDSPKANTTFKENQKLPYPLLCDPDRVLIDAIGLKSAKGTQRGVFIINKDGKILAAEPGSPDGTLQVAKRIAREIGGGEAKVAEEKVEEKPAVETAPAKTDTAGAKDKGEPSLFFSSQAAHTAPGLHL